MKIKVIGAFPIDIEWRALVLPYTVGEETGDISVLPFTDEEHSYLDIVVMVRFRGRLVLTELIRGHEGELSELIKELVEEPFQALPRLKKVLKAHLFPPSQLN